MAGGDRKNGDAALLTALASGRSIEEAARKAGVSTRTVYRRLEEPDFQAELDRVKREVLNRTAAQLAEAGTKAVEALLKLLKGDKGALQLGAARCILEMGMRHAGRYLSTRVPEGPTEDAPLCKLCGGKASATLLDARLNAHRNLHGESNDKLCLCPGTPGARQFESLLERMAEPSDDESSEAEGLDKPAKK